MEDQTQSNGPKNEISHIWKKISRKLCCEEQFRELLPCGMVKLGFIIPTILVAMYLIEGLLTNVL